MFLTLYDSILTINGGAATATHVIQIYDMVPPSATHPTFATGQFGALLGSIVVPGQPFGTVGRIVTVTGLSIRAGTAL